MKVLIELYCTVCQCNDRRFLEGKQRLSNNNCSKFTDDELITVYLWGLRRQLSTRRAIYNYAKEDCPIMLVKDSRSNRAKVAGEICSLTRNSTRNQWYYGVKLHSFGILQPQKLPIPCAMQIRSASFCDLWAAKQIVYDCSSIQNGALYADRAYIDAGWRDGRKKLYNIDVITPQKKIKNEYLTGGDAYSTCVCSIRQPIEFESFFN